MKPLFGIILPVIIISCAGLIVYSNCYHCSFHFDDFSSIVNNHYIRHLNLVNIWCFLPRRFLLYLSLALNYHFNGLNVVGYHQFNLAVHLISAILVWWLVLLTFSTPFMKDQEISRHANILALLSGLVFTVHPVQTEAVTYIVQRTAAMAAMFYLLTLCLYVKSRLEDKNQTVYYAGSLLSAVLAMFSKETAITLPLMLGLYEFSFLKTEKGINGRYLFPFIFTLLIIPLTMLVTETGAERVKYLYHEPRISAVHYLLTQFRVMVTYIRLVFLPAHQNLDYDYPVFKSIFQTPVLISFLFLAAVLYWAKSLFAKYRLVSFGIFWFFLGLMPESSILPIHDVIFEHRLYLPMAGYSVFLVSGIYYLWGKKDVNAMAIVLTGLITCYGFLTYQRNMAWKDEFTLWNDIIQKSPHKARPYINRGLAFYNEGNYTKAVGDYSKAIIIKPNDKDEYIHRALSYYKQDLYSMALTDYDQAIALDPKNPDAYYNKGNVYFKEGDFAKAILDYNKAIALNPKDKDYYNNRGLAFAKEGNNREAMADYHKAIALDPKNTDAYYNLALIRKSRNAP